VNIELYFQVNSLGKRVGVIKGL